MNIPTTDMRDNSLQQYLPFTVLKLARFATSVILASSVATVLTVYGIETLFIITRNLKIQ